MLRIFLWISTGAVRRLTLCLESVRQEFIEVENHYSNLTSLDKCKGGCTQLYAFCSFLHSCTCAPKLSSVSIFTCC